MAEPAVRVLLTGFEPFDGAPVNPSWQLAQTLAAQGLPGATLRAACLPTAFGAADAALRAALAREQPHRVVCLGLANGRSALSFERVAINVDDARIADNHGAQPVDVPIERRGPVACWSTLPIKAMRAAALAAGVPAEISQTAGTFVCNHVFYVLMRELARRRHRLLPADARGGFVHVPWADGQGQPSLPLPDMVRGLGAAVGAALRTRGDLRASGGAEH